MYILVHICSTQLQHSVGAPLAPPSARGPGRGSVHLRAGRGLGWGLGSCAAGGHGPAAGGPLRARPAEGLGLAWSRGFHG